MVLASLASRQTMGDFSETRERIDPPHEEENKVPLAKAKPLPHDNTVLGMYESVEFYPSGQDPRTVRLATHFNRILSQRPINREDKRSPSDVCPLDQPSEASQRRLTDQLMQFVDQVIHEGNFASLGRPDSHERIEEPEPDDDVGPKD